MMEIGDVVRDIFRALGIPEWEVIGMPVPFDVDAAAKGHSRTGEGASGASVPEPAPACPDAVEGAHTRGKVRKRRRRAHNPVP
ncbi:MAG TPA: hypothetical protein VF746_08645 [Longimicrobium sp.]|jgi:hypothetical protein